LQTWESVLRAIPLDHRVDFLRYIRTGEGSQEFLRKLEVTPPWGEVIDAAMDLLVDHLTEAVHSSGPTAVVLPTAGDQPGWQDAYERAASAFVPVIPDEATAETVGCCPLGPEPTPLLLAYLPLGGQRATITAAALGLRISADRIARCSDLADWIRRVTPVKESGAGKPLTATSSKYGVVLISGYRRLPQPVEAGHLSVPSAMRGSYCRSVQLPPSFVDWYLEGQEAWSAATKELPEKVRAEILAGC
jgi:hypothetical protein